MEAVLGVVEATTEATEYVGRFRKKPRTVTESFVEWTIDDVPLRAFIAHTIGNWVAPPRGEVTYLTDRYPDGAIEQIDRLLSRLPPHFDDGRIALLVCHVCFGLDCGAVSAELLQTDHIVEWRDLGWQDDWKAGHLPFLPNLTIRFDRSQYESTLTSLRARYQGQGGRGLAPLTTAAEVKRRR